MSDFVDQKIPKYRDRAPVLPSPNLTRISIPVSFVSTAAASSNEPVGQQRTVYEIPIHRARSTNDINESPMQWTQNEFPRFQPMFQQQQQQPNPQYQQQQQPNPQYQQQQNQPQQYQQQNQSQQYQQQSQPQQYQQQSQPQQYQQQSQPQQYQQQRQPNRFYPYDFDMMNPQPDFVDPTMFQHQQFYAPPFNQQDNWNRQMFEPPNNQFYQQRYFPSGMRQAHSQETVFDNVPMRDRWRQSTPQPAQNEFVRQSKSPSPPNVADLDKPIPMAYAPLKPLQKSDRVSSDSQILNNRTTKTSGQNEEMKFALILNGIDAELNALQAELAKFKGTRGDQQHIYLEEMLTKCLIGCDSVVSDEVSDGIRMRRKQVVKKCQSLAEELDKKVKEKKPEIVVTNTAETENEIQNAKKVRGRVKASGGENEKTRRISENPIPMSYTHVIKSDDGKKEETPPPTNEQPTTDKSPAAEHLEMLEKIDATIDCLAQRLTKVKLNENEKLEIDERITKCILDCDNITGANLETEVRRKRKDVIKKAQGLLDRKE